MRKPLIAASAAVLCLAMVACSGASAKPEVQPTQQPRAGLRLPAKLLGMDVSEENITKQIQAERASYLDSLSLFGFRERKILRGTLQVAHFNHLARPNDRSFTSSIVAKFGATVPQPLRLGSRTVYMSAGQLQLAFLWFEDDWMYVLTVRRDYPFIRTLLRRLVVESQR